MANAATRSFERLNPLTGKVATRAAAFTPDEARKAADAAAAAFPAWSALGPNARRAALDKAADELAKRGDDFVKAMAGEVGATEGWARFNVMLATGMIREAASITTQGAADRVGRLIKDAVGKGAVHAVDGKSEGVLVSASVVDKVTPKHRCRSAG